MDKFIGKRLDGRYEIHDLLGMGGMAYVYRAFDKTENRWVAIKILKEEFSNNSDFLRRFRNESKAIAVLSHPNIVKVFDVSFGDQIQYIVMEYIDGITLKQYIEQEGAIRWNEALHFITQILMALELAHSKGIIHRDIKPQNILLLQNGSIKVTDFGIARFLQSETQTVTDKAIGSVHYIAPEQARGDYITDKADIYSVGVMLYEMLTGKLPFEADNAVSVALMQLQAKPVLPRELNPSLPKGLEQITIRAMQKNPVDRFQSAGEMLDDIERFRRNPAMEFGYHLPAEHVRYDASRTMEAYDAERFAPSYDDNYEYEEEYVRSRKRARGSMAIKGILIGVFVVLLAVGAVWLVNFWNNSQKAEDDLVPMPNLVGKIYTTEVAGNEEYKNFTFKVTEGNDPDKQPGEILTQYPKDGISVKKGREVELTVNGKIEPVQVPELTGSSQADAISLLKQVGLKYKLQPTASETVEVGKIIKTDPVVGTAINPGSEVILYVSSGSSKKLVAVPDGLVGDLVYNATAKIQDAGFLVGNTTFDDASTSPKDTVIRVTPESGSQVPAGSVIDLVVSSGKGAPKEISYSAELPTYVNADLTMKIYKNGALVDTQTVNPSYAGTYTLTYTGTSGTDKIVIQLNEQDYMFIDFNFDSQTTELTKKIDFIWEEPSSPPPSSSSETPSSSSETTDNTDAPEQGAE